MATTKQVRNVINKYARNTYDKYARNSYGIYTNKTKGDTSLNRRVKCYYNSVSNPEQLILELLKLAGADSVTITKGPQNWYANGRGIVVKCQLG